MAKHSTSDTLNRRAFLALGASFGAYAGLVATHRGEFWPLSIYPMFSLAGRPWRRSMVVEIEPGAAIAWRETTLDNLPGTPVSAKKAGANTNDMSKFVQLTERWDRDRVDAFREFWRPLLEEGKHLLLLRADGRLEEGDVVTTITPLVHLWDEGYAVNPNAEVAA